MEKQYSLCMKVLRRLKDAGLLDEAMVIGSWCIVAKGEINRIMDIFNSFPPKWKISVVRALEVSDAMDLFKILSRINS